MDQEEPVKNEGSNVGSIIGPSVRRGQSGGAIGRVGLNNFLTATCGHLTANDNKCVRNPIRILIQIQIGNPIQYMLGATSSSKPLEVSEWKQ